MAVSMNLRDLINPQYSAVTGRKGKTPYAAYLTAMGPYTRAAAVQEKQDTLRENELLQGQEQFDQSQALDRESNAIMADQAKTATTMAGVNTAITAAAMADKAGLINLKEIAGGAGGLVKDAAGGVKNLFTSGAPKVMEAGQVVNTAAGTGAVVDAAALDGVVAAADVGAGISANTAAAANAAELAAIQGNMSGGTAAGSAGSGAAGTAGTVAGVLAIIAAANAARDKWGGTDKEYIDRSEGEKIFSDPGIGAGAVISELGGKEFARIPNQVGKNFDRFAGNPISMAFRGDFKGGMSELTGAPVATLQDLGVDKKTSESVSNILDPAGGIYRGFSGEDAGWEGAARNVLDPLGITKKCIIVTACTSSDSEEVDITREYRDKFLSPEQLRGYYMIAERVVPLIERYPIVKRLAKRVLVDNLIAVGRWVLRNGRAPGWIPCIVTDFFLALCRAVGSRKTSFVRCNGEIV